MFLVVYSDSTCGHKVSWLSWFNTNTSHSSFLWGANSKIERLVSPICTCQLPPRGPLSKQLYAIIMLFCTFTGVCRTLPPSVQLLVTPGKKRVQNFMFLQVKSWVKFTLYPSSLSALNLFLKGLYLGLSRGFSHKLIRGDYLHSKLTMEHFILSYAVWSPASMMLYRTASHQGRLKDILTAFEVFLLYNSQLSLQGANFESIGKL